MIVSDLAGAVSIAAGADTTCAVLSTGAVYCWGSNPSGQLGNSTTASSKTPVAVTNLTGAVAVTLGQVFACALLSSGAVWCWGGNSVGQLGNGNTTQYSVPVQVQGLSGATAIVAGNTHACALVAAGAVQCWGANESGELGNRTVSAYSSTPVPVWGLTGATAIAAGYQRTCALLADGTVKCWGNNPNGGNGTGTTTPVLVTDL